MTSTPRAHIAMFSIAAHGHVNPSLDVIRELVDRGHRVSYAIPAAFAGKVAATGAEPVIYTSTLPTDPDAWGSEPIDYVEPFLDDALQAHPRLADAFAGDEPDLVLHDITSYPARALAHRWGVPAVSLWPNLVPWEGYEEEVGDAADAELMRTERGRAYFARFEGWLAANGLGGLSVGAYVARPRRALALIPEALQPNADRIDREVYTFVGACQGERADQGEWRRPAGAEKVLLVSLGSADTKWPAFYRECVAAFGGLPGWHVVLQIGAHVDPAELGAVPGNIEVLPWVPQLAVLRQADAFVTHAGAGGSQEGLATGTPMVAVPLGVDQFNNADRLRALGVARHVPFEEADAATLRAAVLGLVGDPEVAERCARVREQTVKEGGTRRAADLIEAELPR
ncbi:macrolide family glycosyltransferase [Streptomyces sp. NPDC088729]|uniref:macrolide family glycosyltransferase n=1 Tax=Streptomyces sp. NPDC088729 TaxID=3365876 RepID=UPI0037FE526B